MNGVPGVMALLSHAFLFLSSSLRVLPMARDRRLVGAGHWNGEDAPSHNAMDSLRASSFSFAS